MQELMRESRGDFKTFLRVEPEMFREMLDRDAPRRDTVCYRTVIVRSSCGARTIDITPYGDRAVPL